MLIGELIQRVQSLYSKGVQSDDTRLMQRHIYNKMLSVRSRIISQEYNKKKKISQWNYQTLQCVELIEVPRHECPCIPPLGCSILRSKYELPKPLQGLSGSIIQSVTSIDRSVKIDEISLNAVNSQKGNKYTKNKISYFIKDKYLYISTPTKMEMISISGLFEDPIEANLFKNYCNNCENCEDCIDYQEENFPIDSELVDMLIELCVAEIIQLFSQSQQDRTNNSVDDNTITRQR